MKIRKNPDKSITDELDEYFKTHSNCPCKVIPTRCPCEEFLKQEEAGFCHCGRFEKFNDENSKST